VRFPRPIALATQATTARQHPGRRQRQRRQPVLQDSLLQLVAIQAQVLTALCVRLATLVPLLAVLLRVVQPLLVTVRSRPVAYAINAHLVTMVPIRVPRLTVPCARLVRILTLLPVRSSLAAAYVLRTSIRLQAQANALGVPATLP
jgi:hypothetical protein